MLQQPRRRSALTLVELLVVIGIIATLAAIAAVSFPRFAQQETLNRGADMLQGWLLNAKMRAKRDGVPTGLRLLFTNGIASSAAYIQQPDDYANGAYLGPNNGNNLYQASFSQSFPANTIFAGDYLEILGGGVLRRISADVTGGTIINLDSSNSPPLPSIGPSNPTGNPPNYRIIRQPQLIDGEPALVLPEGVSILESGSLNVPTRTAGSNTHKEILFGPSGAVIGSGTTSAQIILWVQDNTGTRATLICVQPRTGFIAAHPVNTGGGDPYLFTKDARSSGM